MKFRYEPVPDFTEPFEKLTKKDRALRERAIKKIDQILNHPEIGEPKRYRLNIRKYENWAILAINLFFVTKELVKGFNASAI